MTNAARGGVAVQEIDAPSGVHEVLGGIRELALSIDRYRQSLGTAHDLGVPDVITLGHLVATDAVRAGDVARRTGLSQGSVTALLDRLEHRGYTRRVRPPTNRRVVLIELTDAGRALALDMYRPVLPLLTVAATAPDAPDPQRLAHCLRQIASLLADLTEHGAAAQAGSGEPS